MRNPDAPNPVPKGREARRPSAGERAGLLAHVSRRPKRRSRLRLREPQRLPRALKRDEVTALLASLRTWRDRAIAGLMVFCGLRAGEVLSLEVDDVDVGSRWLRVTGKGGKERRVPLDVDVAGVIQTYLLAERPETSSSRLFVVAKGPNRGQPLTPAGLRTIFRYHRAVAGVPAGNPHALRHTFGTALAEAGVDLAVMQALPRPHPYRYDRPLRPPRADLCQGRVRCRPRPPTLPSLSLQLSTRLPVIAPISHAQAAGTLVMSALRRRFCAGGPTCTHGRS